MIFRAIVLPELNSTVTVEQDYSYGLMNGGLYFAGKTVAGD
jgi:hypothetical protein